GWNDDEFRVAGVPFRRPGERLLHLEEAVHVTRGMFGGGPFTYDGRYEHAAEAMCLPRPLQQPSPPIWVGGRGDRLLDLVARVADGWNMVWILTPDTYRERLRVLHDACDRVGRDPATVTLSVGQFALVGEDGADLTRRFERLRRTTPGGLGGASLDQWRRGRLVGTVDDVRGQLDGWAALGVSTVVVSPGPFPFSVPSADGLEILAAACRL
ncbi:MAG TPA: LLM class flavin-dependent oxidoreductase, partial [Acidimicrobiales bacterium]